MKSLGMTLVLGLLVACNTKPKDPPVAAVAVASAAQGGPAEPVQVAQAAAAASASPAPTEATTAAVYRVVGVAANDVLNVRAEPDSASKKVYSYAPSVKNIRGTGQRADKAGTPWAEITFEGGSGWVNRFFLSEMKPNGGCGDPELTAVIRAVMRAVSAADGAALKAVVSPLRGLNVRPESRVLKFPFATVDTAFSSSTALNLGAADGGGPDIVGTFKAVLTPSLQRAIGGKGAKETCGKLDFGDTTKLPPSLEQYAAVTPVSFFFPAAEGGGNDWVTWVGSIEYVDGKPYFSALERFQRGT